MKSSQVGARGPALPSSLADGGAVSCHFASSPTPGRPANMATTSAHQHGKHASGHVSMSLGARGSTLGRAGEVNYGMCYRVRRERHVKSEARTETRGMELMCQRNHNHPIAKAASNAQMPLQTRTCTESSQALNKACKHVPKCARPARTAMEEEWRPC